MKDEIILEDVIPLFHPLPISLDSFLKQLAEQTRQYQVQLVLNCINSHLNDLRELWPTAKPIELYEAYVVLNCNIETVYSFCQDFKFQELIKEIIINSIFPRNYSELRSFSPNGVESKFDSTDYLEEKFSYLFEEPDTITFTASPSPADMNSKQKSYDELFSSYLSKSSFSEKTIDTNFQKKIKCKKSFQRDRN